MQAQVKKLDDTKREIKIEVTGDIVKNKFEEVFKEIAKDAKVKGFRQGNVPRDILEKEFLAHANEMVMKQLIPELYQKAVDNEKLDVIEVPDISEVKLERSALSFKAVVEVSPEIPVKDYKGVKVEFKKISVTPEEIKRHLDSVKESKKLESLDDNFAKGVGYPSLAELEKAVERQVAVQKDNAQRQKIENGLIDAVMKGIDFKLPQSLVDRQMQEFLRQAKMDLAMKGIPRDKIEAEEGALKKELEPQARKQVMIFLVLQEIAKRENIALDEHMSHKVMEFLFKSAQWKITE